ncbi:MAG: hypothetical protein GKR89_08475 [Candidatus Latescibacteria bacterium]|nr:hypothetical protein [Candidatus Latescibacterota bacterium]
MSLLRFPLLATGLLLLLNALAAGLERQGWPLPLPDRSSLHGGLMVGGFLGTLISLERAVALGRFWAYLAPASTGLGGLGLLLWPTSPYPMAAILLGSLGLFAVITVVFQRHPQSYMIYMALGAGAWTMGNILWWLGWPLYTFVPWWMSFLLCTIASERLELSRLLQPSLKIQLLLAGAVALPLVGALLKTTAVLGLTPSPHLLGLADRTVGLGLVLTAAWFWRFDIARRTLRQTGLTRYIALCLLCGYTWLAVGGLLGLIAGPIVAGPLYDAVLHAFFAGFVLAMILGHAPLVFPAVLGLPIAYTPLFYLPLALLQISLALRLASDLLYWVPGQQWGGLFNTIALLLFLLTVLYSIVNRRLSPA